MAKSQARKGETTKTSKIALIVVVVLLVAFVGALIFNSAFLRRRVTAVEVAGVKFSAADASFFYREAITEYKNMVNQYASILGDSAASMLPDESRSYANQMNANSGTTWEYFFSDNAYASMLDLGAMYAEAQANGFALTAEEDVEFETDLALLEEQLLFYGFKSMNEYVKQVYANSITDKDFIRLTYMRYYVGKYAEFVNDSFVYSDAELAEYYQTNKDELDNFQFRYFIVNTVASSGDDVFTVEDVAAAEAKANGYVASIKNEQEFIAAARENAAADDSTLRNNLGTALTATYAEWVRDASRRAGDITVIPVTADDTNNSFYVLYYLGRDDNSYATKNYHEIVIAPKTVDITEFTDAEGVFDSEGYDAAYTAAEAAAKTAAEGHLATVKAESGVDSMVAKIDELIENPLNEASGGAIENANKNDATDAAIREWIYDSARRAGDITLIEDASGNQHVVVFTGDGAAYRDYMSDARMRNADYTAWDESFNEVNGKITFFYRLRVTAMQ